jgi:hypothetical protein
MRLRILDDTLRNGRLAGAAVLVAFFAGAAPAQSPASRIPGDSIRVEVSGPLRKIAGEDGRAGFRIDAAGAAWEVDVSASEALAAAAERLEGKEATAAGAYAQRKEGARVQPIVVAAQLRPAAKGNRGRVDVTVRGTLRTGVMAIGAETTGATIAADSVTWELDLAPRQLEAARKLEGRKATIKGALGEPRRAGGGGGGLTAQCIVATQYRGFEVWISHDQIQGNVTMKSTLLGVALATAAPLALSQFATFDADVTGQVPAGWTCGSTGKGSPKWVVEAASDAPSPPNVLRQSGRAPFPWCVNKSISLADGRVRVKFKPISGKEDQAGGLVWRWKDADNYYVARANALENNVSLYYTRNGTRNTLKYVDAPVQAGKWHELIVEFTGPRIQVVLDGYKYIDYQDTHIVGPGAAGVWTKADSVTAFDDFQVEPSK